MQVLQVSHVQFHRALPSQGLNPLVSLKLNLMKAVVVEVREYAALDGVVGDDRVDRLDGLRRVQDVRVLAQDLMAGVHRMTVLDRSRSDVRPATLGPGGLRKG